MERIRPRVLGPGKPPSIRKEISNVAPPSFRRSGSFRPVIASTSKSIPLPYYVLCFLFTIILFLTVTILLWGKTFI